MILVPIGPHRRAGFHILSVLFLALALSVPLGGTAESREIVFYFPGSHSILPVTSIGRTEYLPLLNLLNLFTHIDRLQGKRKSLDIWFGSNMIEVRQNDKTVSLNNIKFKLRQPVRVDEGAWEVPVDFLNQVLPTLVNQSVVFQASGNRVFIGDVQPSTFTVRVDSLQQGAQLTIQFTGKVDLRTAARNGKWVFFLGEHPVEPLESNLSFQNPYVSDLQFDDRDGAPKLILTPTSVGLDMFPSLASGGKVIVAKVVKPGSPAEASAAATPTPPPPAQPSGAAAAPETRQAPGSTAAPAQGEELPVVVLDAGHGGPDTGAHGENGLLEKNLTSQIVSRVRLALLATDKYRVVLTRIGDADPSLDDRAATANIVHPIAFISVHGGDLGAAIPRINIYTYAPSSPPEQPAAPPLFVPWNSAQNAYADLSRQLAAALEKQMQSTTHDAFGEPIAAPVAILRSVAAPAVAIEVGSLAPDTNGAPLTSATFQQEIADGVVRALAQIQSGAN